MMFKLLNLLKSKTIRKEGLFILALLCGHSSMVASYIVPTGSMNPTILEGDMVVSNKLAYRLKVPFLKQSVIEWSTPKKGEIITFESPSDGRPFAKRVIGVPGDEILLLNDKLMINGKIIPHDFELMENGIEKFSENLNGVDHDIQFHKNITERPNLKLTVPENSYFVMGDNRDNSNDSRFWGFVPYENITGHLAFRWMSFDLENYYLPRLNRIGKVK